MYKYHFEKIDSIEEMIPTLLGSLGNLSIFLKGGKILGSMKDLSYSVEIDNYQFYFGDQLIFETDLEEAIISFVMGQYSVISTM